MSELETGKWNLETLKSVDDKTFDRIWLLFVFIGEEERHFNELQATYRTMASGWLLASFAAIGFVISEVIHIGVPSELLVSGIAVAGGVGIWLLWVVDLLVYHRLLDACFIEGLKLEKTCPWMPPFRHNMMSMLQEQGVLSKVVGFYLGPIILMMLTAGGSLALWLYRGHNSLGALLVAVGTLVVAALATRWTVQKTENTSQLIELLAEGGDAKQTSG